MKMDIYKLKLVAIITMLIDHLAAVFVDFMPIECYYLCRSVGRMAFPLFCFMLVEGYFHTRNRNNYLKRLFIFAIISEIPFDLAFFKTAINISYQNVFFTLFIGLLTLVYLGKIENFKNIYIKLTLYTLTILLASLVSFILMTDYSAAGVILIDLIYFIKKNEPDEKNVNKFVAIGIVLWLLICDLILGTINELAGFPAAILILFYNGKRGAGRLNKMFFYLFYPVHLLLIWILYEIVISYV